MISWWITQWLILTVYLILQSYFARLWTMTEYSPAPAPRPPVPLPIVSMVSHMSGFYRFFFDVHCFLFRNEWHYLWFLSWFCRARYCEYTVANAPKILRMRLNKLPWSHCATWINVRFPPAVCSFLLVPHVVSLVWPIIQNDLFHNLWSHVYSSLTAMFTMTIIQLYY